MANLSLKLKEEILKETEIILQKITISRNAYFNQAVDFFNKIQMRKILRAKLREESQIVASDSMEVLKEFEKMLSEE